MPAWVLLIRVPELSYLSRDKLANSPRGELNPVQPVEPTSRPGPAHPGAWAEQVVPGQAAPRQARASAGTSDRW